MMYFSVIRIIACLVLAATPAWALQTSTMRNLDLCDSLIQTSSRRIAKQLRTPLFPQDTLHISIAAHEGAWMLENALFAHIPKAKRFRALDSNTFRTKLTVRIADLSTRYFACAGNFDALAREISCTLVANVETREGTVQTLEQVTEQHRDTVSRQNIPQLESKQYAFAAANLPEAAPNFWKQVIEPAIVILAGALVVALFFLVRTM